MPWQFTSQFTFGINEKFKVKGTRENFEDTVHCGNEISFKRWERVGTTYFVMLLRLSDKVPNGHLLLLRLYIVSKTMKKTSSNEVSRESQPSQTDIYFLHSTLFFRRLNAYTSGCACRPFSTIKCLPYLLTCHLLAMRC